MSARAPRLGWRMQGFSIVRRLPRGRPRLPIPSASRLETMSLLAYGREVQRGGRPAERFAATAVRFTIRLARCPANLVGSSVFRPSWLRSSMPDRPAHSPLRTARSGHVLGYLLAIGLKHSTPVEKQSSLLAARAAGPVTGSGTRQWRPVLKLQLRKELHAPACAQSKFSQIGPS